MATMQIGGTQQIQAVKGAYARDSMRLLGYNVIPTTQQAFVEAKQTFERMCGIYHTESIDSCEPNGYQLYRSSIYTFGAESMLANAPGSNLQAKAGVFYNYFEQGRNNYSHDHSVRLKSGTSYEQDGSSVYLSNSDMYPKVEAGIEGTVAVFGDRCDVALTTNDFDSKTCVNPVKHEFGYFGDDSTLIGYKIDFDKSKDLCEQLKRHYQQKNDYKSKWEEADKRFDGNAASLYKSMLLNEERHIADIVYYQKREKFARELVDCIYDFLAPQ